MTKLIQSNPYNLDTSHRYAWDEGFEAGQKSTLTPLSVTGRWWLGADKEIYFVRPQQYDEFQHEADNYPDREWLTDEIAIDFADEEKPPAAPKSATSVTGRWWLAKNKEIYFIYAKQYKIFQQATDNYAECRWLTEEETREFT